MKKASKKTNAAQKGEQVTANFRLPLYRSSAELPKKFDIKCEMVNSNNQLTRKVGIRPPFVAASGELFKLSNFETTGQANDNSNNVLYPTKKRTRQTMAKTGLVVDNPNTRQKPTRKTGAEVIDSRSKQPLSANQKPSSAGQQPSTANHQLNEKQVVDNVDSRSSQNPMKRAVMEDDGNSITEQESASKKTKRIPRGRSTSVEEFLRENGEIAEDEDEGANFGKEENVIEEEENTEQIETEKNEGTIKRRTRGPTQCLKIHARKSEDREEVVLDDDGEPIGPTDRTVSDLSCFLGTVARNSDLCPLIYTNFKVLKAVNKDRIWEFVTAKFIISENGTKAVFSRINDAWRRYKKDIKKSCFLKYTTMSERLKHRPPTIPVAHFKQLVAYWKNNNIQAISKVNAVNRAKQKYMHRMGRTNFARIRAKLRAKKEDGMEVSQAEMFIETRQSRKGKQVDEETQTTINGDEKACHQDMEEQVGGDHDDEEAYHEE